MGKENSKTYRFSLEKLQEAYFFACLEKILLKPGIAVLIDARGSKLVIQIKGNKDSVIKAHDIILNEL